MSTLPSNPNPFEADLARIEQIRRMTARPHERASRDLVLLNADAVFLLQFIDKLWKEYSSTLTSPKTAEPCPHEDCHAAWRCTRCGEFRGECPPMHTPETPQPASNHEVPLAVLRGIATNGTCSPWWDASTLIRIAQELWSKRASHETDAPESVSPPSAAGHPGSGPSTEGPGSATVGGVQGTGVLTEEESRCLYTYHEFHGRQMGDPDGAYHRERAKFWNRPARK